MSSKRIFQIALLLFVIIILSSTLYVVDQRQIALILQFGEPVGKVTTPGLHAKVPFIQNVIYFDNRIQNLTADTKEVIAQDQKTMRVDAFTKYKIVDPLKFYETAKDERNFKTRLESILDSSLRQVLGAVPFKALLSKERVVLMYKIRDLVDKQAKGFGVDIVDVRIMRADLPEESRNAVYKRMRTEREKEAKEIRAQGGEESKIIQAIADKKSAIILADAQKQANILKGEGDAEAIKIFAKSFNADPEFFQFYRSLQAYRNSIHKDTDIMVISSDSKFLKYLEGKE